MMLNVSLCCFRVVMPCLSMMGVSKVGMMARLLMVTVLMVLGCFMVVLGRMLMMIGRVSMMLGGFPRV